MTESPNSDTVAPQRRTERIVLMLRVYDALAKELGLATVGDQAKFHGTGRQHWSDIRNGRRSPSAALMLRVAEQFEVDHQAIWRRERVAA